MEEMAKQLADIVEQPGNLLDIANDSHDVDHSQVIEEFNSFARNNPDIDNVASEQLQHGLGKCALQCSIKWSVKKCLSYVVCL